MRRTGIIYLLFVLVFQISCKEESGYITYSQVVQKLTDMKALAELPENGEKSEMWSSYDRESRISDSGEYISWAANIDGLRPQFIRKEGEKEVLAEMNGPGAIVRIWSASPKQGHVRIFIDGNEEPVIDLPFIDYFKTEFDAFNYPELVYETNARGFNNYVPITYNSSCKIIADPGWGQYYHFNYISFPENCRVESFDPNLKEANKKALKEVNDFFTKKMGGSPYLAQDFNISEIDENIPGGMEKSILKLDGKGAIASLKVSLDHHDPENIEEILRKVVLKIRWDGEESYSVWSPLGDFFGTAPGWNNYKTLPMGMTDSQMYSYWYMPFENGAEVILQNDFEEEIHLKISVEYEELRGNIKNLGRFHAKWHRDLEPPPGNRWPDWTLLETEGKGRFVGTQLTVWNPKGGHCYLGDPGHWWWGEGDEKFFIDGETFPSTFGTGTEDYFGYAWCDPSRFGQAFHSQSLDNGNMGYQTMNRWHIIESIPFRDSFMGYLEKYFPNDWPTQYSTVVYWYLEKEGNDPLQPVPVADRYGFETPYKVYREEGAVEGEVFEVVGNSGGWASNNVWADEKLFDQVSGHKVFQWTGDKNKENHLKINFEWNEAGTYIAEVNILKNKRMGIFELSLNGKKLRSIDGYSKAEDTDVENISLGTVKLEPGMQELEIEWVEKENKGNILWLDYLKFIKTDS